MFTHLTRTFARALAVGVAIVLPLVGAPAFAETPATWPRNHVSGLDFVIVLLLIPGGIALIITLLVMLPSLIKGDSYHPGQAWQGQPEWFGGPRKGADAALPPGTSTDEEHGQGGAGAHF